MYNIKKGFLSLVISLLSLNAYALTSPTASTTSAAPTTPWGSTTNPQNEQPCQSANDCLPKIAAYLKHLGDQFGYDLTTKPTATPNDQLLSAQPVTTLATAIVQTYLGALTSPSLALGSSGAMKYLLISPASAATGGSTLNTLSNNTFEQLPPTSTSSSATDSQPSAITTNTNTQSPIDQQPYQIDPVTQILLNFTTTPPSSYCLAQSQKQSTACLSYDSIVNNSISLPTPLTGLYQLGNVAPSLPQINANTLLTPLIISTQSQSTAATSSPGSITVDQVSAFIRYASDTMIPLELPDYTSIATTIVNQTNATQQAAMFNQVKIFVAGLNTYLSQISVGLGNLYYILSKRMPQSNSNGQTALASQAYNEYNMATWRLFNAASSGSNAPAWITQINAASPATVQKEMAILLAEINYQMYLSREQQERLLLTNSILLLMSTKTGKPDAGSLTSQITQLAQGSSNSE